MNEAANKDDIRVFVGLAECNIISISSENLYCTPPSGQPPLRRDGQEREDGIPRVFVCIVYQKCLYLYFVTNVYRILLHARGNVFNNTLTM